MRRVLSTGIRAAAMLCRRSTLSLFFLLAYLVATIGYPQFPVAAIAAKKGSEPFPCQFSACGCRTLEQCRVNCCCHSKKEKVAWALQRGIHPDRVAILSSLELAQYTAEIQSQTSTCCKTAPKKSCCSQSAVTSREEPKCCSSKAPSSKWKFVSGISARKCRGSGTEWMQAGLVGLTSNPIQLDRPEPVTLLTFFRASPYLSPTLGHLLRPA